MAVQLVGWSRRPTREHVQYPRRAALRHRGVGIAWPEATGAADREARAARADRGFRAPFADAEPRARDRTAARAPGRGVAHRPTARRDPTVEVGEARPGRAEA